jgi:AcrR family transcriptional regulator
MSRAVLSIRSGALVNAGPIGQDGGMTSASAGARATARAQIMSEIVATGRRHLAEEGAAALSLRAVARDLGMVSSAVYRYVAGRDELLTLLIVTSYDALGEAVERAEARVDRSDLRGRWLAACVAARRWALRHPHEYALIYGSPVPGYAAPSDTVGPASRVARVLITVVLDGVRAGASGPSEAGGRGPAGGQEVSEAVRRSVAPLRGELAAELSLEVSDELVVLSIQAWTHLFGAISFELFGHRHGVVADAERLKEAFFVEEMTRQAAALGI